MQAVARRATKRQIGKKASKKFANVSDPLVLPHIFTECLRWLELRALQEEGLFRISGDHAEIERLLVVFKGSKRRKVSLESLNVDDPHTVAGLLKGFIRDLQTPLLVPELSSLWLDAAAVENEEECIDATRRVVRLMPAGNRALAARLFRFLHSLASFQHVNMMSEANLATCFAPNVLDPSSFQNVATMTQLITLMIKHFIFIFSDDDDDEEDEEEQEEQEGGGASSTDKVSASPADGEQRTSRKAVPKHLMSAEKVKRATLRLGVQALQKKDVWDGLVPDDLKGDGDDATSPRGTESVSPRGESIAATFKRSKSWGKGVVRRGSAALLERRPSKSSVAESDPGHVILEVIIPSVSIRMKMQVDQEESVAHLLERARETIKKRRLMASAAERDDAAAASSPPASSDATTSATTGIPITRRVTASLIADEDYVLGVYRDAADGQYRMNETSFIREYNLRDMDKVLLVREEREAFRSATAAEEEEVVVDASAASSPPASGDLSFGPAPNKKAPKPQKKATPSPYGAVPNFAGEPVGCVKCDAVSPPSADGCVECGGELDPFMCVRCSLRYPSSKIFCSECGVKLPGADLPDEQVAVAPTSSASPEVRGSAVARKASQRTMTSDPPAAAEPVQDDADQESIPLDELCEMVLSFRIDEVKTYIKTKPVAEAERITLDLTARLEALAAETTTAA